MKAFLKMLSFRAPKNWVMKSGRKFFDLSKLDSIFIVEILDDLISYAII